MKTLKAFSILTCLLFGLYACKKTDNTTPASGSVVGRWNLVTFEIGGENVAVQPGDYYLFTSDGSLVIKQGGSIGTWGYAITPDSLITMTPPVSSQALSEFGHITTLTAHSLVINGPYPISPGGPIDIGSSIVLSR